MGSDMFELDRVLKEWADGLIAEIRSNMQSEGVNATGETSRSLESRLTESGVEILGAPYFAEKTEIGTTPWSKGKPGRWFRDIIAKWIEDKGLKQKMGIQTDRQLQSVAFLTSRKIAREGSSKYRGDRPKTDVFGTAAEKAVGELAEKIGVMAAERAGAMIDEAIRDAGSTAPRKRIR